MATPNNFRVKNGLTVSTASGTLPVGNGGTGAGRITWNGKTFPSSSG